MAKIVIALFAILIALSPLRPASAQGSGNGSITGVVVNGTPGGPTIGTGIEVDLITLSNGEYLSEVKTVTDSTGRYSFSSLSTSASTSYQVVAVYLGIHYASDDIKLEAGQAVTDLEVKVYETTDSDATITISLGHVVFYPEKGALQVKEYYIINNSGDRTYTGPAVAGSGGKRGTLNLSLPEEATDVQYTGALSELNSVAGGGLLVTTAPLVPGGNAAGYNYKVKNSENKYIYSKTIEQAIEQVNIVAQGEGIRITGKDLMEQTPLDVQGTAYAYATRINLNPGDTLTAEISGLAATGKDPILWVVVAMGLMAVGGGTAYALTRRRRKPVQKEASVAFDVREQLLEELAGLDDDFESGRISEEQYRELRKARKAELVSYIKRNQQTVVYCRGIPHLVHGARSIAWPTKK